MQKGLAVKILLSISLLHPLIGCSNEKDKKTAKKNETSLMKISTNSYNQLPAQNAEKQIRSMEEITAAKAIVSDKELYVAALPQHHERFQLDRLKKKMKKKLDVAYPDLKIYVSVDKKIFMLIGKLKKDIKNKKADKKTIEKKIKKIKEDMHSDT
ncbi:YhcN/YlaJ family sporulation lipoprotein [Ectobacillus panaciterrae]|uniref:YhcN/YlaJ family sporulation lipoprotein n=1 Tax=Ectobacillus panaciterrae TaxID=363872 RepID=UPI00040F3862|nr:YhcN/YlaJ family sporulation lipoprotein [Ectobacillus panaciterrae]